MKESFSGQRRYINNILIIIIKKLELQNPRVYEYTTLINTSCKCLTILQIKRINAC